MTAAPPLCNGTPCTFVGPPVNGYGPIAPGVSVKITGSRFACKTIQPDDQTTLGHQGTCLAAVTGNTVLVKRISTQLLEASPTVHAQTAQTDGRYNIIFTMPNVTGVGSSDAYRLVPHSPDCPGGTFSQGPSVTDPNYPNTCESGKLNAGGVKLFQN